MNQAVSPLALYIGHIIRALHGGTILSDDTQVNVGARAQVIEHTTRDGIPHQLLGFIQLGIK